MNKVFIVVFEGAYGLQIEDVFSTPEKAREYISNLPEDLQFCYNFEIIEKNVK